MGDTLEQDKNTFLLRHIYFPLQFPRKLEQLCACITLPCWHLPQGVISGAWQWPSDQDWLEMHKATHASFPNFNPYCCCDGLAERGPDWMRPSRGSEAKYLLCTFRLCGLHCPILAAGVDWEKHVAALPRCLDSSDLLSPTAFPPLRLVRGKGRGDHQAGSSRLHSTYIYIYMSKDTQHSLFISSHEN